MPIRQVREEFNYVLSRGSITFEVIAVTGFYVFVRLSFHAQKS